MTEATADMVREQFANARNAIQNVLNDAYQAHIIDAETGQQWMDLFSLHSAITEDFLLHSTPPFGSDKGLAAIAVLNMVMIALVAGSREPNLASAKLKSFGRFRAANARAAKQPYSSAVTEIVAEEFQRWSTQKSARKNWTANAVANEILEAVNLRLAKLGHRPLKQDAIAKRLRRSQRPDR
jgi:hypothetical protein